nr:HK97 family phage prohead protease [uncultured Aminipila sp.]
MPINKNEMLVTRAFPFAADQSDDKNVDGMAAVYNQRINYGGYFEEVIESGAFDECDFRDVLFFINHNTEKITLARSRRNNPNSTMQLEVNNMGLHIRANLDTEENYEAKALISAIKRGDIDGMSFMFRIKEQKWENLDTDLPLRRITKIAKVIEVSAVNFPAYDETSISARGNALDSDDLEALDRAKADFNSKLDSFNLEKRKFLFKESMR